MDTWGGCANHDYNLEANMINGTDGVQFAPDLSATTTVASRLIPTPCLQHAAPPILSLSSPLSDATTVAVL